MTTDTNNKQGGDARTVRVAVQLPEATVAKIDARAAAMGLPRATIARMAMVQAIEAGLPRMEPGAGPKLGPFADEAARPAIEGVL